MSDDKQYIKCLECGQRTNNFYSVPNNRGKIHKCKDCYELSFSRGLRSDYLYNDIHHIAKSMRR